MSKMTKDYRDFLNNEFEKRFQKNDLYTLRAFARDLGVSSGRISEILNQQQGLSRKAAISISKRLKLKTHDSQIFLLLVDKEHARSKARREIAILKLEKLESQWEQFNRLEQIQADTYAVISEWYYFAILELTQLDSFQSDPQWIADALHLDINQIIDAIDRLTRLDFLGWKKNQLVCRKPVTTCQSSPERRSMNLKYYQLGILEKAKKSIEKPLTPKRDISAIVLSVSNDKLPEFKKSIIDFRRKFAKKCDELENKDEVYCLAVQFFPLSEIQSSQ